MLVSSCKEDPGILANTPVVALEWPELVAFAEISGRAHQLAEARDRDGLMKLRTSILEVGWTVTPKSMPENVPDPERIHFLIGDLSALVNGFARSDLTEERLFNLARAIDRVAGILIDRSGISPIPAGKEP